MFTFLGLCFLAFCLYRLARWLFPKDAVEALNVLSAVEAEQKLQDAAKAAAKSFKDELDRRPDSGASAVVGPKYADGGK